LRGRDVIEEAERLKAGASNVIHFLQAGVKQSEVLHSGAHRFSQVI